jgi:hypothetical protein
VAEALLAQVVDPTAHGGQAGTKGGKVGCFHLTQYYYCATLDGQIKMSLVKNNSASLGILEEQYDRLRKSLAQIGYISQGSVLQRSVSTSGRSGYQWTRKVAQKTITVSLSQPQFLAMKAAVRNERKLWKTIQQMEKLSRQILFASLPDTHRRKRLTKKVLGLN